MTDWKARTRTFAGFAAAAIVLAMTMGAVAYARSRTFEGAAARITGDTMARAYLIGKAQNAVQAYDQPRFTQAKVRRAGSTGAADGRPATGRNHPRRVCRGYSLPIE